VRYELVPLVVSGLMEALKTLFADAWGTRMEGILRAALYAIVEAGEGTLPDVLRILHDESFRKELVARLKNEEIKRYWTAEFPSINPRLRGEMILPVQTKISALLCDPRLHALFTRKDNVIRFRKLMDEQQVVIVNLSKGRLGTDSASLVGSMMLTAIAMAGLSRASVASAHRPINFVSIDECHLFGVNTMLEMAAELRKYGVGLTLAHQSTTQLGSVAREAILGIVGNMAVFRVGVDDAGYFMKKFGGHISMNDLLNLPARNAFASILIDGEPTRAFSMKTLALDD
jgi:hypothetical protein